MSVFTKDIYIKLPKYDYSCDENSELIGREEAINKLSRRITPTNSSSYKGCYLVSGYRGMGKTSLVDHVIKEVDKKIEVKGQKICKVDINLTQDRLTDYDLLKQMFVQFNTKIPREKLFTVYTPVIAMIVLIFYFAISWVLFSFLDFYHPFLRSFKTTSADLSKEGQLNSLLILVFFVLSYILVVLISKKLLEKIKKKQYIDLYNLYSKLDEIDRRINSGLEINSNQPSSGASGSLGNQVPFGKIINTLNSNDSDPYKQIFEKLSAKELEFELKEALEFYKESKYGKNQPILFIIDELDKLEADIYQEDDLRNKNRSRIQSRRDNVAKLLANLKSFVHTAEAKFIFIGGAEMYDASLADIVDRESFYGSVFHEVIYISSFFQDYDQRRSGLTQMTESYLIRLFFGKNYKFDFEKKKPTLKYLHELLSDVNGLNEADFIIYQLHRFVVYLTYRTNGSPKKLKELIEHFLVELNIDNPKTNSNTGISGQILVSSEDYEEDGERKLSLSTEFKKGTYLWLKYRHQYKIGLLANFVLPYVLERQKHMKIFNDKNLYLSAFFIDHILKFHKSAFSWRELETTPDIILGSKGPNLRDTLKDIISYLTINHIRLTSNAMFQYKFRSRTKMELEYISKISDESAAAFNFSYDESLHLKSFFKRKLKRRIEASKNDKSITPDTFNHAIAQLNTTIADLHYYDEEYDSAIRYYAAAIQPLRDLSARKNGLNNHQKILLIKVRLLLSLCLEKTHRYDTTYSTLRTTVLNANNWAFSHEKEAIDPPSDYLMHNREWEVPYKRMQLFLRPHLAILMIIEKDRSDGITESNLRRNIYEYTQFMGLQTLFPYNPNESYRYGEYAKLGTQDADHKRLETLLADYYQNTGSLLFFKNRNFKSIYEYGAYRIWNRLLGIKDLENTKDLPQRDFHLEGVEKVENVKFYMSLDNVRVKMLQGKTQKKLYFPSFLSTFYYIISFKHVVSPFQENIKSIFVDELGSKKPGQQFVFNLTEKLIFKENTKHVLNGKQKELLGLTMGKLADSILSSLGDMILEFDKDPSFKNYKRVYDLNHVFWKLEYDKDGEIPFRKFFSLNMVFYLLILSSRSYALSGVHIEALFALKKCLYIIKTLYAEIGVREQKFKKKYFIIKFKELLVNEMKTIINTHLSSHLELDKANFNHITNYKGSKGFQLKDQLISNDMEEIIFLENIIDLYTGEKDLNSLKAELLKEKNILNNIFLRIQRLRYTGFIRAAALKNTLNSKRVKRIEEPKYSNGYIKIILEDDSNVFTNKEEFMENIYEMNLCFKNLLNIINTYGFTYIMSYSYFASLYASIYKWSMILGDVQEKMNVAEIKHSSGASQYNEIWALRDSEYYKSKALSYFQKSISLHSEGAEYKEMIRDMYILEDDLNDSLIHFCCALERSLINTGIVQRKIEELKK